MTRRLKNPSVCGSRKKVSVLHDHPSLRTVGDHETIRLQSDGPVSHARPSLGLCPVRLASGRALSGASEQERVFSHRPEVK
jgi:hypothetical protein